MGTKRLIRRALIGLAGVAMLCLSSLCFGEIVIVRVLSEADRLPLAGLDVTARLRYADKVQELVS